MQLYIFRHGIAEDAKPGQADSRRALTDEGRRKVADVVKAARRSGVTPSLIVSSPYVRAVETAEIAAREFGFGNGLVQIPALVPSGTPEEVWEELRLHRDEPSVVMAGHEPLLSHLTGYLLACTALRVEMKKAAMVRIDLETFGATPRGTLRWMITPGLC